MGELGNVTPALSLEGYEKETDARRGAGVYRKILDAFERLRRHGVPFGISITPTDRTWDLLTSDYFLDFCVEEQGAVYIWCFQHMPIGRDPDLDLMIAPENRLEMLKRTRRIVFEKKILFADFWNKCDDRICRGISKAQRSGMAGRVRGKMIIQAGRARAARLSPPSL